MSTTLIVLALGLGILYLVVRDAGPRWPVGTDLGHGITVTWVEKIDDTWLYNIEYSEGRTAGPYTEPQLQDILSLYR